MRPPRLRCTLFPLIYPPHLLVLLATLGLHLHLQTYPYFRALYVISVRRTKSLLTASFRFHLTMDTLAVQLYTSSLPRRVRDFHPLERAHGAQTNGEMVRTPSPLSPLFCKESAAVSILCRTICYCFKEIFYILCGMFFCIFKVIINHVVRIQTKLCCFFRLFCIINNKELI